MWWDKERDVGVLLGVTLSSVRRVDDVGIEFRTTDGRLYVMQHHQDCCEQVTIEEVIGDLDDLVGSPIIEAECVTNRDDPPPVAREWRPDSYTWTFYKFRTAKGCVTVRWYGESNGYYSEEVSFDEETGPEEGE